MMCTHVYVYVSVLLVCLLSHPLRKEEYNNESGFGKSAQRFNTIERESGGLIGSQPRMHGRKWRCRVVFEQLI